MDTWRDTTSQQAQDDLDGLLNAVMPLAQQTLARYGVMLPFGAATLTSGDVSMLAAYPGDDLDALTEPQVLEGLKSGVQQQAGEYRAVAFVADGLLHGADAILVDLEHREGVALRMMVPYRRHRFPRRLSLNHADGALQRVAPEVWAND